MDTAWCAFCVFLFLCTLAACLQGLVSVLWYCWVAGARVGSVRCVLALLFGVLALCLQTLLLLIQARKRCVGRTKCAVQAGVHRFRRLSCESDAFLFGHVQAGLEQNAVRFRGCRRAVKCASTQGRYGTNMLPHQSCSLWSSVRSGVLFGFGGPAKWN
jgi:hypothetical protein